MDWIFAEKPDPATPPVSWALEAIPAMFQRETPLFERDLGILRQKQLEKGQQNNATDATEMEEDDEVDPGTGHTFDNFLEMKASSTPFFKPEKIHLKRRRVSDLTATTPKKLPKTGGILKGTHTGGGNDTVTGFGHKNVSFAASLGSTTNSISEQLPSEYAGADQTPVVSSRGAKFVKYDPVNDDTKTMFRKLDDNMGILQQRRDLWGDTKQESSHVAPSLVKSKAEIDLELALAKIKHLEEDKRRYMNQSNSFEKDKLTAEHDLQMLKHKHKHETDTLKMTIEHLQSKMNVTGCEHRVKEHKLQVAEARATELQNEMVEIKNSSEQIQAHLNEQVTFLTEKIATMERKERNYRANEKIASRQREDFNRNWTFRNQGNPGNHHNHENVNIFNDTQNPFSHGQNSNQTNQGNAGNQGNAFSFNFNANANSNTHRQPLGSFDLNVKRNSGNSQKTRNIFGHARQPSTTPKQPPPSYLRGGDVEMADMRFFR